MSSASPVVCARCGIGLVTGVDSALKNAVIRRDGFKPMTVKIHKRDYVCTAVVGERGRRAQLEAAEYRSLRARIVRLARRFSFLRAR